MADYDVLDMAVMLRDMQKIQVHSLWLTAAAKDLLDQEQAVSVADKIKEFLK